MESYLRELSSVDKKSFDEVKQSLEIASASVTASVTNLKKKMSAAVDSDNMELLNEIMAVRELGLNFAKELKAMYTEDSTEQTDTSLFKESKQAGTETWLVANCSGVSVADKEAESFDAKLKSRLSELNSKVESVKVDCRILNVDGTDFKVDVHTLTRIDKDLYKVASIKQCTSIDEEFKSMRVRGLLVRIAERTYSIASKKMNEIMRDLIGYLCEVYGDEVIFEHIKNLEKSRVDAEYYLGLVASESLGERTTKTYIDKDGNKTNTDRLGRTRMAVPCYARNLKVAKTAEIDDGEYSAPSSKNTRRWRDLISHGDEHIMYDCASKRDTSTSIIMMIAACIIGDVNSIYFIME